AKIGRSMKNFDMFMGCSLSGRSSSAWCVFGVCSGLLGFACRGLGALVFSCFRVGMHALPLCGAAPTFLCGGKEK
ncbi:MAG TPA: hypothetical protein VMJ11_03045, partial [Paraburkholderia sp.]|nr:hypothetical protein [Paraburkholderia sp.]